MKSSAEVEVPLPRGWWTGERWEQRVRLLAVDECAEEALLDRIDGMLPVERDTTLLLSCVLGADGNALAPPKLGELSMGDRVTLLLLLRRLMLGNTMQCLLQCPICAEKMDLRLNVDDLIVGKEAQPQVQYEEVVRLRDQCLCASFHLPTGDDVVNAVRTTRSDPERAAAALAKRCIDIVTGSSDPTEAPVRMEPEDWPETLISEISARIEELDPQAEVKLRVVCPACGHPFEEIMDSGGYLHQELAARQRVTCQEVHQLARAYHWSEADILRMGPRKRQLYLELLAADYE